MAWVLVIHEHRDMCSFLAGTISNVLEELHWENVDCHKAINLREGEQLLLRHGLQTCDLIVAGVTTPLDADQAPDLGRTALHGVDFARRLREGGNVTPPIILLGAHQDLDRLEQLIQVVNVELIVFDFLNTTLPKAIQRVLSSAQSLPWAGRVDLTIDLRETIWRWHLAGRGPGVAPFEDGGVINIKEAERKELLTISKQLNRGGTREFLNYVGEKIYAVLMEDNKKNQDLRVALEQRVTRLGGGLEVARISFNVGYETHDILFECLAAPKDGYPEPDFWAFKAPFFRKFGSAGEGYALYKDKYSRHHPLDCLIIQGNIENFAFGKPVRKVFPAIPGARDEVDWLSDYLDRCRSKGGRNDDHDDCGDRIGEIRVLRYDGGSADFQAEIRKSLEEKKWGLIHYAGHSVVCGDETGYLALGGGAADLMDIRHFAEAARQTQFIFLSSCKSADTYFILRLAHEKIPAVAGYAWEIDDGAAYSFAENFYTNLFEGSKPYFIEYAFMRARQKIHDDDREHPYWAAPLLVMQIGNAELDV